MSEQTFTITVNVRELLTGFIPKLARQFVAIGGMAEKLKGTALTLTVDISGALYSYSITDGVNFDVKEGPIDNPMVYLAVPLEAMSKFADMKNIDMLLGQQGQLSKEKNNFLAGLKGTSIFRLKHEDGEISEITATFNGAQTPKATITISMEDAAAISRRQETPIQLFMNGRLSIDGDMAFAMALQPLFS